MYMVVSERKKERKKDRKEGRKKENSLEFLGYHTT
jgi:hypothetical protein